MGVNYTSGLRIKINIRGTGTSALGSVPTHPRLRARITDGCVTREHNYYRGGWKN